MKKSIRWYLAWGIMVASLSMLFFTVTAGPAFAWSQARNQLDETGSGTAWCSGYGTNGTDSRYPCLYWQEPYDTSVHLNFLVDTALGNVNGYDFTSAISWAFTQWNGAPAWNPYMAWNSGQFPNGYYWLGGASQFACNQFGLTNFTITGSLEKAYNPQRGGTEYYEFIKRTDVYFDPSTHWNNADYFTDSCHGGIKNGDGFIVATHESGHVQGMGESGAANAVMGGGNLYLQQDDKDGIAAIYPGNQEHT